MKSGREQKWRTRRVCRAWRGADAQHSLSVTARQDQCRQHSITSNPLHNMHNTQAEQSFYTSHLSTQICCYTILAQLLTLSNLMHIKIQHNK